MKYSKDRDMNKLYDLALEMACNEMREVLDNYWHTAVKHKPEYFLNKAKEKLKEMANVH